jgi:hypothetical protein
MNCVYVMYNVLLLRVIQAVFSSHYENANRIMGEKLAERVDGNMMNEACAAMRGR